MKANYHTHCYRCKHAVGSEEDYIESAIRNGLKVIGISDHGQFPDDSFLRMDYKDVPIYLNELDRLKEKYKKDIKVLKSFEIEYLPQYNDYYEYLLNDLKVDYLLCGQHNFMSDGKMYDVYNLEGNTKLINYALSLKEAMESGYFKIIAHPDLIFMNEVPIDAYSRRAVEIILDAAEETNTVLELNANGIRKGLHKFKHEIRYKYPSRFFWEQVSKRNINVVIGSDCHDPKVLNDICITKAEIFAKDFNLRVIDYIDLK